MKRQLPTLSSITSDGLIDRVKVLHPTRLKIGHYGDVLTLKDKHASPLFHNLLAKY